MANSPEFKTNLCRLAYARSLFTAQPVDSKNPGGKKKYNATLIFPKTDVASREMLEKIAFETIMEEWPKNGAEMIKNKVIKTPFFGGDSPQARNQETGELHKGMGPDVWFIRVTANHTNKDGVLVPPPKVVWKDWRVEEVEAFPNGVYSGCYGKALLNAFTTDHETGGKRLSFGISMFQKLQEGDLLGGIREVNPEKWFETIADEGDAPESTKSGAGASGLFG